MFFSRDTKKSAPRRKARSVRLAVEGLESRTVLSTLHVPAVAVAAVANAHPEADRVRVRAGQITIGGTVSLPVSATGNLTIQSFSANNNQLTATGSLNINGVAVPVTFNANVTQQGSAAPVMTLTPTTGTLNVSGVGNLTLDTATPITVSSSSGLSTLLGQVSTTLGGVTNISGLASGLDAGLNANNDVLNNFAVNGTVSTTVGVQRFVNENGLLAAQVLVNGNTQLTLPLSTSASTRGGLSLSSGTGSAIMLGNTGLQLQAGQSITLPINGAPGRIGQVINLIARAEAVGSISPRLEHNFVNALNRLVHRFTGQINTATSLIGGTVSLPVSATGNLTIQSFSANNNQLTATGSLNINGVAVPVTFNANVTQQGSAAPVMTLTATTGTLNVSGVGNLTLDTTTPITVSSSSGLSTLLGQVSTTLGGVTNISGLASGLNAGLNANNDVLSNFAVAGTLSGTVNVDRFINDNGQLVAQVTVNGTAQATIPVNLTAQSPGNIVLSLGAGNVITLGNAGLQVQTGQSINVPINGIPGPGNLVVNLLRQLDHEPRRLNRIVGELNGRLVLGARLFG